MMTGIRIDLSSLPSDFMDRFWDRVAVGAPDECWEWKRGRTNDGYGAIHYGVGTKSFKTHRVALAWKMGGVLDGGVLARHTCDNPPCVNPSHLLVGDASDNMHDRASRGRHPRGSKASQSRLVENDVVLIREMHRRGVSSTVIAARFGITAGNVGYIVRRKTWTHVA